MIRRGRALLVVFWVVSFGLAAALHPATAQPIPNPVIMVVDTTRIMNEAKSMQSIRGQIDQIRGNYQAEIKEEEDALRRADQEMAQQRQVLSPEAFSERRQELQERAASLQMKARTRRSQLDQALRDAVGQVRNHLLEIVQAVAERHGANIVVQKSDLVYADSKMEFTEEVLQQLNSELATVRVEPPQG